MRAKNLTDIMQMLMIVFFLTIPPWLSLTKYFRGKVNRIVLVFMFILYLSLTLLTQNIFPFLAVLLVIIFIYKSENDSEERFCLRPIGNKKLEVVILSFGFKFFISILNIWFAFFVLGFGVNLEPQKISQVFMNSSWSKIIFLSFLTVVTAPVLEEFVFRHTFYRQLSKRTGKIAACVISSALFALLHFNFLGTISFFGVGIFNCFLYDKYGYRAAVLNHFVFNSISTLLMIGYKLFNLG
jgi:uncharacterized protein